MIAGLGLFWNGWIGFIGGWRGFECGFGLGSGGRDGGIVIGILCLCCAM